MLRNVRILVSFFGLKLVTTEHYQKTLLWESNVTVGLFAGLEVRENNLLSISYTDYHNIKTVDKS